MNTRHTTTNKGLSLVIWISAIIALFCFFLSIHPLIVFDTDDWLYISYERTLWPDINEWNPTRILPEITMPLFGTIGAFIIYPFNGDYIDSLSISIGIAAVISIVALCIAIYAFYRKIFHLSELKSTILVMLFLSVGFVIYKTQDGMMYFYSTHDASCFFYYILSGIVNAVTVLIIMILILEKDTKNHFPVVIAGGLAVLIYLSVNSNLFQSIILSSFVSSFALLKIITGIQSHKSFLQIVRDIWWAAFIDLVWLVSLIFEINGARAGYSNSALDIVGTLKSFKGSLYNFSRVWLVLTFLAVLIGLFLIIRQKDHTALFLYITFILSGIIIFVFLVLLCSKVDVSYIARSDVIWGGLFYVQLLANISMSKMLQNKYVQLATPFLLFLLFFKINNNMYHYSESNVLNYKYEVAKKVDEDLISQITEAEKEGKGEIIIYTPYYGDENSDGWPFASYAGNRIGVTLYRHNIVNRQIYGIFERTYDKNIELALP